MNTAARWFIAANAVLIFHAQAWAQKHDVGQTEYLSSCGACHGSDAKGRGPMADQLKVAPADLTSSQKRMVAFSLLMQCMKKSTADKKSKHTVVGRCLSGAIDTCLSIRP
jgi:hypothetical protein